MILVCGWTRTKRRFFSLGSAGVLLLCLGSVATAQEMMAVRPDVSLAPELGNFWGGERTSCGMAGAMVVSVYPPGALDAPESLTELRADGGFITRIDWAKVPGFEFTTLEDYAPGPNNEIYVLAYRVSRVHEQRDKAGKLESGWTDLEPHTALLRFAASGPLIAEHYLSPRIAHPKIAVLASGDALIVGLAKDGPYSSNSTAILVSADGKLLHQARLPELLNVREPVIENPPRNRTKSPMLIPLVNSAGEAFIFREGTRGAMAAISSELQVSSVRELQQPDNTRLSHPILDGDRLLVRVETLPPPSFGKPFYAEFEIQSGKMTSSFFLKSGEPACARSQGITFFDFGNKAMGGLEPVSAQTTK